MRSAALGPPRSCGGRGVVLGAGRRNCWLRCLLARQSVYASRLLPNFLLKYAPLFLAPIQSVNRESAAFSIAQAIYFSLNVFDIVPAYPIYLNSLRFQISCLPISRLLRSSILLVSVTVLPAL